MLQLQVTRLTACCDTKRCKQHFFWFDVCSACDHVEYLYRNSIHTFCWFELWVFYKNEMKYLLHANLTSRSQKLCAIYCSELTTHEKLNCVKNIFRNCCSIWSSDESLNKKCEMKWKEFRNLMNINAIAINWAFIAFNHFLIISMLIFEIRKWKNEKKFEFRTFCQQINCQSSYCESWIVRNQTLDFKNNKQWIH